MRDNQFELAKDKALRYLVIRARSEKEIRDYLKKKEYPLSVIDKVVGFLYEYAFLDDAKFALSWAEYKLQCGRGKRKVAYELKLKGISVELIEDTLSKVYIEIATQNVIVDLIKQKKRIYKKELKPFELRRKLIAFLLSRGFNYGEIKEVVYENSRVT